MVRLIQKHFKKDIYPWGGLQDCLVWHDSLRLTFAWVTHIFSPGAYLLATEYHELDTESLCQVDLPAPEDLFDKPLESFTSSEWSGYAFDRYWGKNSTMPCGMQTWLWRQPKLILQNHESTWDEKLKLQTTDLAKWKSAFFGGGLFF